MKLTVITPDNVVIKDGEGYVVNDLSYIYQNIHAIQWDNDKGEVEFVDNSPNLFIDDLTPYNQCLVEWQVAKNKEEADNTPTEQEWEKWFRDTRNDLLYGSDWTQSPDSPLTDEKKKEWQTYRQALRDMPTTKTVSYQTLVEDITHYDYPKRPS